MTSLGAATVLEPGHLWIHTYGPLAGDLALGIIIDPFSGDDLRRGATFLNPIYQGQHRIMFSIGESRHRVWDRTFQGCLLIGSCEVPRGIVGYWSALTVSYDVVVRRGQLES